MHVALTELYERGEELLPLITHAHHIICEDREEFGRHDIISAWVMGAIEDRLLMRDLCDDSDEESVKGRNSFVAKLAMGWRIVREIRDDERAFRQLLWLSEKPKETERFVNFSLLDQTMLAVCLIRNALEPHYRITASDSILYLDAWCEHSWPSPSTPPNGAQSAVHGLQRAANDVLKWLTLVRDHSKFHSFVGTDYLVLLGACNIEASIDSEFAEDLSPWAIVHPEKFRVENPLDDRHALAPKTALQILRRNYETDVNSFAAVLGYPPLITH